MPTMHPSNPRPSGRPVTPPKDQQNVPTMALVKRKDVIFYDQSHYIHENKQNMDKMPRQYMDIFGKIQPNL
jgi:hypothetical protein